MRRSVPSSRTGHRSPPGESNLELKKSMIVQYELAGYNDYYYHKLVITNGCINGISERVERESTKSPATTNTRKKTGVKNNGQITTVEPPPQPAVRFADSPNRRNRYFKISILYFPSRP
ncbi:jg5837 [Pararge aegeria aegeria]|uniref:Jg5837 protein n=1 Tax=Pararge aegeria aegeria TaxID=348720 RepID=A0A8S4RC51_9NEOP|nr:jg5837 [Pararge aegeria aegeria]